MSYKKQKISLDIKLRRGVKLAFSDTKFDRLDFVVGVEYPRRRA
jgi:hypothetical protein